MKTFQILLLALVLAGCASDSPIVNEQVKPAIEDYKTVIILTEMPEGAEEIATVKASSMDFSQQQNVDAAVENLRQQAAKVGANAVVIVSTSTKHNRVRTDANTNRSTLMSTDVIEGVAVWVDDSQ